VQQAFKDRIRHAGMEVGAGVVESDGQHTVFVTDGRNRTRVDWYHAHNFIFECEQEINQKQNTNRFILPRVVDLCFIAAQLYHATGETETKRTVGKYLPRIYFPVGRKSFSAICQPSGSPCALLPLTDLVSPQMIRQCTFKLASLSSGYARSSFASGAGSNLSKTFKKSEYVQL